MNKLLLSSFLFLSCAECTPALQNLKERLDHLEKTFHHTGNSPALLAPGPYFQVDLLFWQARETGLPYAIIANEPLILGVLPKKMTIKEPNFEWDFGFRLGAGYGLKRDGWDFFGQWTRFVTDAHDNGSISSSSFFLPIWAHPDFSTLPFDPITETKAHWMLQFNAIDAGLGRSFYISKYFVLRPFIGPSSIWIHQHYHIEYEMPSIPAGGPEYTDRIHLKNAFFGIGARVGCELRFHFTKALSLLTRGAGAIYAGRFEVTRTEKFNTTLLDPQTYDIDQPIHAGRAATSLEMGFCWEHALHHNRYVRIELCYDIHYFFKQNQMQRVISKTMSPSLTFLSDQGDLSLHGGSFSLTLGF
jgi:hypothetical protein